MDGTETDPGTAVLGGAARAAAVAAIRAQLRGADPDDAALIALLAESAAGIAELFLGWTITRRLVTEAVRVADARWTALKAWPVRAITAVADADGAPLAGDAYAIDIAADGTGWVRLTRPGGARVTLEAGRAVDWDGIPAAVRHGIVVLAAHLAGRTGDEASPPAAVAALWRPYRRMTLTGDAR